MIKKEVSQLYQEIKAPDDLRDRILSKAAEDNIKHPPIIGAFQRSMKPVLGLVGCFLLIILFSIASIGNFGDTKIHIAGALIGEEPVCVSENHPEIARMSFSLDSMLVIPIEVESKKQVRMEVTKGVLQLFRQEELIEEGAAVWVEAGQSIQWHVSTSTQEESTCLNITIGEQRTEYLLYQDLVTGVWFMTVQE